MKKLTASHFNDAMAYALLEPEFNLFLIGDLENYGLESENVSVYTADTWTGGTLRYSGLQEQFPVLQSYHRLQQG